VCVRLESRSAGEEILRPAFPFACVSASSVVCIVFIRDFLGAFIDVPASSRPVRKSGDMRG